MHSTYSWNLFYFIYFYLFILPPPRSDRIENFIDENKALMRRMYGDFEMTTKYGPPSSQRLKKKRSTMSFGGDEDFLDDIPGIPDMIAPAGSDAQPVRQEGGGGGESYFSQFRAKRQSNRGRATGGAGAAGGVGAGTTTAGTTAGTGKTQGPRLNPGPTNTENTGR